MFHRMFGRRRSPAGEEEAQNAVEATEEKPEFICNDGFVVIGDSASVKNELDPPPGYTVGGANAFLPKGTELRNGSSTQRSLSFEGMTAIDGIPFKFASNILQEDSLHLYSSTCIEEMIDKIKSFNWDDYEYSFELERSIMREFSSAEYNHE